MGGAGFDRTRARRVRVQHLVHLDRHPRGIRGGDAPRPVRGDAFLQPRAGHAAELFVQPEKVLQSDGGQRLVLPKNLHAFLGFNRLVHSFAITTSGQHATRVLINDQDFAIHNDVILVELEEFLCLDGVV